MADRKHKYVTEGWERELAPVLNSDRFRNLMGYLKVREEMGITICPPKQLIFRAMKALDFDQVRVVIVGSEPYNIPGVANGFAFAADRNLPPPATLRNILAEARLDTALKFPRCGHSLNGWVQQGVMLLNSVLTVEEGCTQPHHDNGWEELTDLAIKSLSDKKENLVFLLWGDHAGTKEKLIQRSKHQILKANHPHPSTAHEGFFGCQHFSKTNLYLERVGKKPIDWTAIDGPKVYATPMLDLLGV